MDWAVLSAAIRFDIRAERAECERLFNHQARVLQDRLERRGHTDRTKQIPVPEWEEANPYTRMGKGLPRASARTQTTVPRRESSAGARRRDITLPKSETSNYAMRVITDTAHSLKSCRYGSLIT